MAPAGFEGFEKRLELHFPSPDPIGLRRIPLGTLQLVLDAVGCSIVSAAGNRSFDAYVLSESSLFVYPHKIVLKTCGTTQLLNSIPLLLRAAARVGLRASYCRYSRGAFTFPDSQPFPHSSFRCEAALLDTLLPARLSRRKAQALRSWHVYSAADVTNVIEDRELFTVEVCMTELDRARARAFYRSDDDDDNELLFSGDETGKKMTAATGINGINPRAVAFGFAFDPCGYSMNGLDGDRYSTIHVTPEEGYSYASFECVGERWDEKAAEMLAKAVRVFAPGAASVSVTGGCVAREEVWSTVEDAVGSVGMECRARLAEDFPGAGQVTYQTFTACRK